MAYVSQERKRNIAAKLKPVLAKYGVKGSLSVQHHSAIVLKLKSGKVDFVADSVPQHYQGIPTKPATYDGGISINEFWFHEHYTGTAKAFLTEVYAALKSDGWFDHSDIMTDYFNVAYYTYVHVGSWETPYLQVA